MCHSCFHQIFLNGFIEIINESKLQPSKLWVEKGKEFYNSFMRKWLDDNDILMYLTSNEKKSVVAERFIRILKNPSKMTGNNSKSGLDYLNELVDECNNSYHLPVGKSY